MIIPTLIRSSSVRTIPPALSPENSFIPFFDHSRHFTAPLCSSRTQNCFGLFACVVVVAGGVKDKPLMFNRSWGMSLGIWNINTFPESSPAAIKYSTEDTTLTQVKLDAGD